MLPSAGDEASAARLSALGEEQVIGPPSASGDRQLRGGVPPRFA
jgi:hypothetical protein